MSSSLIPQRKVMAGGLAGAVTAIVIAISRDAFGYQPSPDLASAVTTLIAFVVSYFVPASKRDRLSLLAPAPQKQAEKED